MNESSREKCHSHRRLELEIYGIVQGVGFRPTIYKHVLDHGFKGFIQNHGDRVLLVLEGRGDDIEKWVNEIDHFIPPHARIDSLRKKWKSFLGEKKFFIKKSEEDDIGHVAIPPDFRFCDTCKEEFFDSKNRRYLYPFTSCTHCGPRFSIVCKLPYDRKNTSMRKFPLCLSCLAEYESPLSRRFHAENLACPDCGPRIKLLNKLGEELNFSGPKEMIKKIHSIIDNGKIIAIKGIGGLQLVCNAKDPDAIKRLREKKKRPHQALAVMTRDHRLLDISDKLRQLLNSKENPIVIQDGIDDLPMKEISPDLSTIGVFLPTTFLHYYLFGESVVSNPHDFLIVTSGNIHGLPMIQSTNEGIEKLNGVADYFIDHNRDIIRPIDDSVISYADVKPIFYRRGRGYSSNIFTYEQNGFLSSLACGGDLKNSFSLSSQNKIFFSPHIGDLYNTASFNYYKKMISDYKKFYRINPQLIIVDKHPQYASSQFGESLARLENLKLIKIQHHLAHSVSVMAENRIKKAIAISFDGTGFGDDDTLWGGECFAIDLEKNFFPRVFSFTSSKLLGGEQAVLFPERQAFMRIFEMGRRIPKHLESNDLNSIARSNINFPKTSSVGRLFDAVSAFLMPRYGKITYEGQGAMALEALAKKSLGKVRPYKIFWREDKIDATLFFEQIYLDWKKGIPIADIAYKFHLTLGQIVIEMGRAANSIIETKKLALSGGVFQNNLLSKILHDLAFQSGFELVFPLKLPIGDGGICLGQLVLGNLLHNKEDEQSA